MAWSPTWASKDLNELILRFSRVLLLTHLEVTIQVFIWSFKVNIIHYLPLFAISIFYCISIVLFNTIEVPEIPFGLKVLDKSGRTVQLSWLAPYDGNSPITRYIVEYKLLKSNSIIKQFLITKTVCYKYIII